MTAKELAKLLNLSPTAVSMALRNKPGVSIETRKKVLEAAEKYGLEYKKENTDNPGDIYFVMYQEYQATLNYAGITTELIEGIRKKCREKHYNLRITELTDMDNDIENWIMDMRMTNCVGIILLGTSMDEITAKKFLKLSVPVLIVDACFENLPCSSVTINNVQGAYVATDYLIKRSNKQPGYIASSLRLKNFEDRKQGFLKALHQNGMSSTLSPVLEVSPTIKGAFVEMLDYLNSDVEPMHAYFCENDLIALGVMKALTLKNYKIPEDVAVIGFDNVGFCSVASPPLTSIEYPWFFMGETAVRQLMTEIEYPTMNKVSIQVYAKLIKRISV